MRRSLMLFLLLGVLFTTMLFFTQTAEAEGIPSIPAHGDNLVVTRNDDPIPDGCAPSDCSLREAIIAANADPDLNFVIFSFSGLIELSIPGAGEDLSATGDLDVLYPISMVPSVSAVTIDANGLDRVLDFPPLPPQLASTLPNGGTSDIFLTGLVGGNVDISDESGLVAGGGIRIGAGRSVELHSLTIRDNQGSGGIFGLGGGIGNEGGTVLLDGVSVVMNSADNAAGIATVDGTMTIENSTISTNSATNVVAGILNLSYTPGVTSTLTLDSVTIAENVEGMPTTSGAGLDTTSIEGAARTTILNSVIDNNGGDSQCYSGGTGSGGGIITSNGYNIASDDSCSLTSVQDLENTDATLEPLTQIYNRYVHPVQSGPAINSGFTTLPDDQIGTLRPDGAGDDRGAMEQLPPTSVTVSTFGATPEPRGLFLFLGSLGGLLLLSAGVYPRLPRKSR